MALCTRCGQQTEADAEFCSACTGYRPEASSVGSHSGAASRPGYSPASDYGAPPQWGYSQPGPDERDGIDPAWYQEPDPAELRSQLPPAGSVPGQYAPEPMAADRDRQFRYEQPASGAEGLPQFARHYPGTPASPPLSPTGREPDLDLSPHSPAADSPSHSLSPYSPAADAPPARRSRDEFGGPAGGPRNGRWIALAASMAVLVIAVAVAVVLVGHHGTAGHSPQAGLSTSARPSATAATSSSQPAVHGLVTVAPGAATAPHEPAVVAFLNRYFSAINHHSYAAYEQLFSPALRGGLSAANFSSGYGTTRDSAVTLRGITVVGAGQLDALVTFTSHQRAADSPTQSPCTAWSISLYLIKHGHRYLLQAPPSGYQASYHRCS